MKKLLIILSCFILILASCKSSFTSEELKKPSDTKPVAEKIKLPTLPKTNKVATTNISNLMVKTGNGFDAKAFEKAGLVVNGKVEFGGNTWWFVESTTGYATKKVSKVGGVLNIVSNDEAIADWTTLPKGNLHPENSVEKKAKNSNSEGLFATPAYPDPDNQDLDPVDAGGGYSLELTKARDAYKEFGYGTEQVVLGVIDTGINMLHNDLKGVTLYAKSCQTAPGGDYIGDGAPHTEVPLESNWDTQSGHGTHVSGTMAALGNKAGTNGVAWKNTRVISYQGLGAAGSGRVWSIYGALLDLVKVTNVLRKPPVDRTPAEKAILPSYLTETDYQITQKVIPVNMSLGGPANNPFALDVINYALENNVLPVIAMGNEGTHTNSYPAALPGVISVGACNYYAEKAAFSTKGQWITVSAPGDDIMSTTTWNNNGPEMMGGTSMATPFVTGALGYLLSFDGPMRTASPYQIKDLLRLTSVQPVSGATNGTEHNEEFGYGIINVYNAAKVVTEKVNFPVSESFYREKPVVFKATYRGTACDLASINIIDSKGVSVMNAGAYADIEGFIPNSPEKAEVQIKGLQIGETYRAIAGIGSSETRYTTFTVTANDVQEYTFDFQEGVLEVITVKNNAYNEGKDETDTILYVYRLEADTTTGEDKPVQILAYDDDYLDRVTLTYNPGRYVVLIEGYTDDTGTYRGGNYVFCVRNKFETIVDINYTGENILDGDRLATDADSHEDDNDIAAAITKGNVWNQKLACTLTDGDMDYFYFEIPEPAPAP